MKNVLKLSFLTVGIAFCSSVMAQEDIKKEAATAAEKLEAPKSQDPVKSAPATSGGASKTDSKTDTSSGTRMAITEQGMPRKNKNKAKKAGAAATTTPPATAEPKATATPPKN